MASSTLELVRASLAQARFEPSQFATALRTALAQRDATLIGPLDAIDGRRSGEWLGNGRETHVKCCVCSLTVYGP